jgi:hypothetical protein
MAMGKRKPQQDPLFFTAQEIPRAADRPFYSKVNLTWSGTRSTNAWSIGANGFTRR